VWCFHSVLDGLAKSELWTGLISMFIFSIAVYFFRLILHYQTGFVDVHYGFSMVRA